MKKMLFLINPVAGRTTLGVGVLEIVDTFVKAGYDVEVRPTQSRTDISEVIAGKGEEYDTVVCCGGDGTLNNTVAAVAKLDKKPNIGYIPAGTTNDFAHSHSIPCKPLDAARTVANNEPTNIDMGMFGDKAFVYVAAFGIFSEVSYSTSQELKNVFGRLAYLVEGAKSLNEVTSYAMRFETDDKVITGDFIYGMVSNSSKIGGFNLPINKDSELNDGLMEVTLVRKPETLADSQQLLNILISQKADDNLVYHFQTNKIRFISAVPIEWSLDGEGSGEVEVCDIKVIKDAVKLYCGEAQ